MQIELHLLSIQTLLMFHLKVKGWLLDLLGRIGTSTAFLNITYSDFHNLKKLPSHDELMKMIILIIFKFLKDDIKKHYTNDEIFHLFGNRKVLLFLFGEKMISFNKSIVLNLIDIEYGLSNTGIYLYPENLEVFREIEYSDNPIFQIIQKDLIDDFILHINTNKFDLNKKFEKSLVLETNQIANKYFVDTPIKCAAFFRSIKIFKYLYAQKCDLNPVLWIFAIHSRNQEIILILEESNIELEDRSYEKCLSYAIKISSGVKGKRRK